MFTQCPLSTPSCLGGEIVRSIQHVGLERGKLAKALFTHGLMRLGKEKEGAERKMQFEKEGDDDLARKDGQVGRAWDDANLRLHSISQKCF